MSETKGVYSVSQLELKAMPLSWAIARFLDGNVKKHDIGALYQSIKLHGFRDPLGHDDKLNGGKGGIIEGNGRLECLAEMFKEDPNDPPKGIGLADGDWLIPIIFGCDSKDEQAAIAYALDHNLTMLKGGNRTAFDILYQDFDYSVFDQIREQFDNGGELASIDGDELDEALRALEALQKESLTFDEFPEDEEPEDSDHEPKRYPLALALDKELFEDWNSYKESIKIKDDLTAFSRLLGDVNHG